MRFGVFGEKVGESGMVSFQQGPYSHADVLSGQAVFAHQHRSGRRGAEMVEANRVVKLADVTMPPLRNPCLLSEPRSDR
jgi:hypothetical protein